MHLPKTNVVTNSPAPKIAPIDRKIPSEPVPLAAKLASTSGAPFANASKVTPAKVSLKPNLILSFSKLGVKKSSAVDPNNKKHKNIPQIIIGR